MRLSIGDRVTVNVQSLGDIPSRNVDLVIVGIREYRRDRQYDEMGVHFLEMGKELHNDWLPGCGYRSVYRCALEHAVSTAKVWKG